MSLEVIGRSTSDEEDVRVINLSRIGRASSRNGGSHKNTRKWPGFSLHTGCCPLETAAVVFKTSGREIAEYC